MIERGAKSTGYEHIKHDSKGSARRDIIGAYRTIPGEHASQTSELDYHLFPFRKAYFTTDHFLSHIPFLTTVNASNSRECVETSDPWTMPLVEAYNSLYLATIRNTILWIRWGSVGLQLCYCISCVSRRCCSSGLSDFRPECPVLIENS